MRRDNKRIASRWKRLDKFYKLGVSIILALVILALSQGRLYNAISQEGFSQFPIPQLSVILLLETLWLILLWIKINSNELQMLQDYLFDYVPDLPKSTFRITVGISVLLCALVYFSNRIVIYCSIFVLFKLFEIWGSWVRNSKIEVLIEKARQDIPAENKEVLEAINAIEFYYLKTPGLQVAVTVQFFCFVSLIFGILGKLVIHQSEWLTSGAYLTISVVIFANEIIVLIWRRKRDAVLEETYH